jgi:GT2 family glycosyltransferase
MDVAVVILNYNGQKHLETFLPSVVKYSSNARIVVADNASTDHSVQWLKENHRSIECIQLDKNYGYAGGYNVALQHIQAKYFILLNSDVEVSKNWIEPLVDLAESKPEIAAIQPKIKSYLEPTKFEYAGAAGGYLDSFAIPYCRGRIFDTIETDEGQYNDTLEIDWATGACLFIRKDLFEKVGKLDARFFAHMEEIDLCWRLRQLDYKIYYCGKSEVYHLGGGTLNNGSSKKVFLNFRNSLWMISKNNRGFKKYYTLLIRLGFDGVAGLLYLLKGKPNWTIAIIKAHWTFFLNPIQPSVFYSPLKSKINSIIINYYLKGKKHYSDLD